MYNQDRELAIQIMKIVRTIGHMRDFTSTIVCKLFLQNSTSNWGLWC